MSVYFFVFWNVQDHERIWSCTVVARIVAKHDGINVVRRRSHASVLLQKTELKALDHTLQPRRNEMS